MLFLGLILLTIWSSASGASVLKTTDDEYDGYRLPNTQFPSKYIIDLVVTREVFAGTSTTFNGTVQITFRTTEATDNIKLHSSVIIRSLELESNGTSIPVGNHSVNETTRILTIPVTNTLNTSTDYTLNISFTGTFDTADMHGFYRSSYEDSNGTIRYLVTTQFEPTHARRAFPCFDEPQYKAQFLTSLTYPRNLSALSNTPQNGTAVSLDADYEKVTFMETPTMSTYLIAYIISDFTCTAGENIDVNVPYRVCSRNDSAADRSLSVQYGTPLLNALENMTAINYIDHHIGKMDQVAIPDFSAGAMENWGLVTYRETALLWNNNESSNSYKQRVVTVVAHEFSHMWFGNLVTMEWWDYTFLNEGFARYCQYFILTKIPDLVSWEMDKQFVIEQQQSIFTSDSSNSSASLTSKAASPSQISDKFSSYSYNKGASILRMTENFIGSDNFINGVRYYLRAQANSTSVPSDLWNALTIYTPAEALPAGVTLHQVMENWVDRSGFPVITVSASGNDVILSQKRFLYSGSDSTEWYVPISYTGSSDSNKFENVAPRTWLIPGSNITLSNFLQNNSWIILNNQESAYYRIMYDDILRSRIKETLLSNHTHINVLNRAQIIDDTMNLARAGQMKYSEAFDFVSYVKNETEYYPWYSAITAFNYLNMLLGENSVLGKSVNSMLLELMQNFYRSVSFSAVDENDQIYTLKLVLALVRACKLGEQSCITSAKELFENYKAGTSIDKNLRSIVYCNALRYSDNIEADWQFLWEKFHDTDLASEQVTIISALGCTKNSTILKYYLEQSINASSGIRIQDLANVWSAVYATNAEGLDAAAEFIFEHHQRVYDYYSGATSLLSNIVSRFNTDEQIRKIEEFVDLESVHSSLKSSGRQSITTARANLLWFSNIREDLEVYFNISSGNVTTTDVPNETTTAGIDIVGASTTVILVSVFLIKMIC